MKIIQLLSNRNKNILTKNNTAIIIYAINLPVRKNEISNVGLILFIFLDARPIRTGKQKNTHDIPTVKPSINPSRKYLNMIN